MEGKFYGVKFTESAEKDLKKINKSNKAIAKLLKKWFNRHTKSKAKRESTNGKFERIMEI